MNSPGAGRKYNRKPEEAKRLGVGVRTLDRMVAGRMIPYYRLGKILLFDPNEVDRAMFDKWRVPSLGEQEYGRSTKQRNNEASNN